MSRLNARLSASEMPDIETKEYDVELTTEKSYVRQMDDGELLANIGYKQEFKRSFGLLSMIGFSFSILTCWTAISGALGETMLNGGPVSLLYGWIGVSIFSIFVVVSLADICSAYPVSGGQYSWCLLLAKDTSWGRVTSYICGWIQLSGLVCMVSTALYQFGIVVTAMAILNSPDESFDPANWRVVLFCWALALLVFSINVFGSKILSYISSVALYWSLLGFVICTVTILACCAPNFESADFVFTKSISTSEGWSNLGMAIILGLCQSAYGMCCYDAPAHMAEELNHSSRDAPRAMVMAVLIGGITGLGFIFALLFVIQDLEAVAASEFPLLEIFYQATSSKVGALCLISIVFMCQVFAATALLTEGSRSIYAFARDGAFPWKLNKWLQYVSPTLNVPVPAIILCTFFACVFIAILFGSSAAFFTILSIASTGLYVSYLMPIVVYTIRGRKTKAPGYYNLGTWTNWFHIPAIIFLVFFIIFFFFPTTTPVDGNSMNYCVVAFGITGIFGLVSWFGGARHTYNQDVALLESVETALEAHAGSKEMSQNPNESSSQESSVVALPK